MSATWFVSLPVHYMLIQLHPEPLLELHMYTNHLQIDISAIIKVKKNKNHNDKLTVNLPTFCILSVLDVNWLELSCKRLSGEKLCLCSLLLNCASCRHTEQQQADRSSVFLLATEIKRGTCSKVIFLFFFFRKWCYVNWSVSESW